MARGLEAAGFTVTPRHADVQTPGKKETLRIHLAKDGAVVRLDLIASAEVSQYWTFANGNHNRFPFVQVKTILVGEVPDADWKEMTPAQRRACLRLAVEQKAFAEWVKSWPGKGLRDSLLERRPKLAVLVDGESAPVLAVVDRALAAFADPERLFRRIAELLVAEVEDGDEAWLEAARRLLLGNGGALYFDVGDFPTFASDPRHIPAISRALSGQGDADGICALTGRAAELLKGNYPKPTLPGLGGVYLYSKNPDIPAAARYGRVGVKSLPVSQAVAEQLGSALLELTKPEWRGRTWHMVPSERPTESDLLIAFFDPDVACAELLAGQSAEEEAEEDNLDPRALYVHRTRAVVETIKGKARPAGQVEVCLLRRVDPGNHKAIYHRQVPAAALCAAAERWQAVQDNLPPWLRLPLVNKARKVFHSPPRMLAPLQLPMATRVVFAQGGTRKLDVAGMTAADAFALFLDERGAEEAARNGLRLALRRFASLLSGTAQALRCDSHTKTLKLSRDFDRSAALRACAVLGLLLAKRGRHKENYMREAAFKLGQLLAVADVVHVGYCVEMRNGQVPPTLIGNSVLTAAQANPAKALALLLRRWKPYHAWARRTAMKPFPEKSKEKLTPSEWAVRKAVSSWRRADELSRDLHGRLPDRAPNDAFRAELLLGYLAGLPKRDEEHQDMTGEEG